MFTISVETGFEASHQLILANGSKEPLHNHKWRVTANVSSAELNDMGIVFDFHQLRAMVDNILADLTENSSLGSVDYFRRNNPSAENVAKYIYDRLESQLPESVKLQSIKVVEGPGCSAKFAK